MTDVVSGVLVLVASALGYYLGEQRGIRDTEQRWSDAVNRKADAEARYVTALPELPEDAVGVTVNGVYYSREQYNGLRMPPGQAS